MNLHFINLAFFFTVGSELRDIWPGHASLLCCVVQSAPLYSFDTKTRFHFVDIVMVVFTIFSIIIFGILFAIA